MVICYFLFSLVFLLWLVVIMLATKCLGGVLSNRPYLCFVHHYAGHWSESFALETKVSDAINSSVCLFWNLRDMMSNQTCLSFVWECHTKVFIFTDRLNFFSKKLRFCYLLKVKSHYLHTSILNLMPLLILHLPQMFNFWRFLGQSVNSIMSSAGLQTRDL